MFKTQVTIAGNVVFDPELRATRAGEAFASLRIAVNARVRDKASGAWVDSAPSYYNVAAYGNLGINVLNCVHKGDPLFIVGDLTVREYEGQQGVQQRSVDIKADHIGHDLNRGPSAFTKDSRPTLERLEQDSGPLDLGRPADPSELHAVPADGSGPESESEEQEHEQVPGHAEPAAAYGLVSAPDYDTVDETDYVEVEPQAS